MGPVEPWLIAEFADVNDRGQAIGMTGPMDPRTGFKLASPVIWQAGWNDVRPLALPRESMTQPVLVTELNDINDDGTIVGNAFALTAKRYDALRGIHPVLWTCAFGR